MRLIVGLGNPGKQYEKTRHNVGFMVLDALEKQGLPPDVWLLKPDTFMNNSGKTVKSLIVSLAKLSLGKLSLAKELIVIHDDIDIPLGKIKISLGRGSAGHKGVESIIKELGTKNFTRIRVGIQPASGKPKNVEGFVLKNFSPRELTLIQETISQSLTQVIALAKN